MLEATIHGSRKEDEKPSYLHHHVPKRAHGTKGKSGSTATRTRQSCSPRPRSKVRSAHDFPFHGGREASCAVPKEFIPTFIMNGVDPASAVPEVKAAIGPGKMLSVVRWGKES